MFVGVWVIEILEFNRKKKKKRKTYTGFSRFCRFFPNIISFQHVLHFDVGRSQIDWNVKVKGQILICTAIMLNDHSNPFNPFTSNLL